MSVPPASNASPAAARQAAQRATFFRQSGWMMVATIIGGGLMWLVHLLSKYLTLPEYGTLITLFSLMNLIPTLPIQMVFTQQTALCQAQGRPEQLAGLFQWIGLAIIIIWAAGALGVLLGQQTIASHLHLSSDGTLPLLLLAILLSLAWPVFAGLLQGSQNFLWLGSCSIINAACRIGVAGGLVVGCHGHAASIMWAVALGLLVICLVGAWQTQACWRARAGTFDHHILTRQVLPLMLGFAATQFLFSADTAFVDFYFGAERTAPYGAAGTLSRALLWLVLPLAGVMFPKLVHSHATAEKSQLLALALLITAGLAAVAFVGLWLVGPWLVPLIYRPDYSQATLAVLPWYAGAMIPLALGNVLVNDLLARGRFQIVPALVVVAVAYGLTLSQWHPSTIAILKLLGGFNTLLLVVAAGFAWREK